MGKLQRALEALQGKTTNLTYHESVSEAVALKQELEAKNHQAARKDALAMTQLFGESDRGGFHKEFIPEFLYKPPYGYPRFQNITEIRAFAQTPYAYMAIDTIAAEVAEVEWDIVRHPRSIPNTGDTEALQAKFEEMRNHIVAFLENPNENKESFYDLRYMTVVDMLELNSGVWIKHFNLQGDLVGIVARDGGMFLKNPDVHGMLGDREEMIFPVVPEGEEEQAYVGGKFPASQSLGTNFFSGGPRKLQFTDRFADGTLSKKAAYFQFGYKTPQRPIPFGKRELVWFHRGQRTDTLYPASPVEICLTVLKVLLYGARDQFEYFADNNIPKGVFSVIDAHSDEIKEFKEQWFEEQHTLNALGQQVKKFWNVPTINKQVQFERFQFSPVEMELIAQQKWFSKILWACFRMNPSELGFTEDSNKATEGGQDKKLIRKAINPILRQLEYHINREIITEFGEEYAQMCMFVHPEHDIDEDLKKADLYSKHIQSGVRTINEIRSEELGLDELSWGDLPPNGFGMNARELLNQSMSNPDERDDLIDDVVKNLSVMGTKKKDSFASVKANNIYNNPLIMGEGEVTESVFATGLEKVIDRILDVAIELYERRTGKETGASKKSLGDDIKEAVKGAVPEEQLRGLVSAAVRQSFLKGHDSIEERMNMNFQPDKRAMEFIEDHVFDNVKGMTDDLAEKFRGIFERGIIDGRGPQAIADELKKATGISDNRAEAIARTELTRARNAGIETTVRKNGVKGHFVWRTVGDRSSKRATKICNKLEGQKVRPGELFSASAGNMSFEGTKPPAHVNCRSYIEFVPEFESELENE